MDPLLPLTLGLVTSTGAEFETLSGSLHPHRCHRVSADDLDALEDWGGEFDGVPLGTLDAVMVSWSGGRAQIPLLAMLSRPSRKVGTPLLALTNRAAEDTASLLLTGADTVLAADVDADTVYASVRAYKRLRSASRLPGPGVSPVGKNLHAGCFTVDFRTFRLSVAGTPLDLPPRQFDLLVHLMRRPGEVVSKDEILNHVWGFDFDPNTNIVNVYVHYLRQQLGRVGYSRALVTVRGRGFLFDAEAAESPVN